MVDIWRELTDIDTAEFGWELREPIVSAFKKLYNEDEIQKELSIIGNYGSTGTLKRLATTGDAVIQTFLEVILKIRSELHVESADDDIYQIVNNYLNYSYGDKYKLRIYKVLKAYMNASNTGSYTEPGYNHIVATGEAVFLAGNELMMIKSQAETEYAGLRLNFDENVREEEFTVTIENLFGGANLVQTWTPVAGQQGVNMWIYDEITNLIPPGIIKVTITDSATGAIRTDVHIDSYACKFGMAEPEGYFQTYEENYVYTTDATSAHILLYIGPFKRIKTPVTLDNKPVESISSSAFYEQDMQAVKIIGSPDIID